MCQFHEAVSTDPLRIGISKARPNDSNQKDELGLTGREEGQQEEGGENPPEKAHSLSGSFGDTGLSSVFSSSYSKAARLLVNSGNIVKAPGDHNTGKLEYLQAHVNPISKV